MRDWAWTATVTPESSSTFLSISGPWIEDQDGIVQLDRQPDTAAGSPFSTYWDVGFDHAAPLLLIGLADGDDICGNGFGWDQFWRLRTLASPDGTILMLTQVTVPESQHGDYAVALDRLDSILTTFDITG